MRRINKQLLVLFLILGVIVFLDKTFSLNKLHFLPTAMLCIAAGCFYINKNRKDSLRYKEGAIRNIVIIMTTYLIIYMLSGLIFSYVNSPYNRSLIGILKNLWMSISIIITGEYIRYTMIKFSALKGHGVFIITILFIILEINFGILFDLNSAEVLIKTYCLYVLPVIVQNILASFLCYHFDYRFSLAYLLPLGLMRILLPIYPDLNWFLVGTYSMTLALVIYLSLVGYMEKYVWKLKIKRNHYSLFRFYPMIIVMVMFVLFLNDVFVYKGMAILSNSMETVISRGDIVVTRKISDDKKPGLYDIIEYVIDGDIIVHRIVAQEIDDNGKIIFVTKGDNNDGVDNYFVYEEQVRGVVLFKIPYLGFPTVWFSELLKEW